MDHLNTLKILNFVWAALMLLSGLVAGVAVGVTAVLSVSQGDVQGAVITGVTAAVLILALTSLGLLFFATGRKVAEGRWRVVQTLLVVLTIGSFPLGTAYGAYAVWVCWLNEETKRRFA